jgi:hypothetical protein
MFQLYKKRGFSDFLNDTFAFLKLTGKHYFKNYTIICGGFLLILTILGYILGKAYMAFVFSSIQGKFRLEGLFGGNIALFVAIVILFVIIIIIFSFLSYLYPMVYLKLYDEHGHAAFSTKVIGDRLRAEIGRTVKFTILTLLFTFTVGLLLLAIMVLLFFTVIGIPFAFIGIFALAGVYNLAFFLYVNDRAMGFIDSFKTSFEFVKNNLWPVVGSNFAMSMLIQIIGSVFALIPFIIGMVSLVSSVEKSSSNMPETTGFAIAMGITVAISLLVSYFLQNLLILNNGMIYYTMQEANHSHFSKSEIDLIGTESEF